MNHLLEIYDYLEFVVLQCLNFHNCFHHLYYLNINNFLWLSIGEGVEIHYLNFFGLPKIYEFDVVNIVFYLNVDLLIYNYK